MWILAKSGFTSTVNYDPSKDLDPKSPFPNIAKTAGTHKLVRARRAEHLEPIRKIVPNLTIVDDRGADYRYRAVVKNEQFVEFVVSEIGDIDYWSHFKEAMRAAQPANLKEGMYRAAMSTWTNFANLQESGWSSRKSQGRSNAMPKPGKGKGGSKPLAGKPDLTPPRSSSLGTVAADYGFKADGGFELPTVDPKLDDDRGFIEEFEDMLKVEPDAVGDRPSAVPSKVVPDGLTMDELVKRIQESGGKLEVSAVELTSMDDDAFELMTRIQEEVGSKAYVSDAIVTRFAAELRGQ